MMTSYPICRLVRSWFACRVEKELRGSPGDPLSPPDTLPPHHESATRASAAAKAAAVAAPKPPTALIPNPPRPGRPTRYAATDWRVDCVVELVVEALVDVELLEFAWIAVSTACWSVWIWVIWAAVKPILESTAVVSVCTCVTAAVPVSVPLRIASRSSSTAPVDSCVGVAPLGVSVCSADCRVCMAVWTADHDVDVLVLGVDEVLDVVEVVVPLVLARGRGRGRLDRGQSACWSD